MVSVLETTLGQQCLYISKISGGFVAIGRAITQATALGQPFPLCLNVHSLGREEEFVFVCVHHMFLHCIIYNGLTSWFP